MKISTISLFLYSALTSGLHAEPNSNYAHLEFLTGCWSDAKSTSVMTECWGDASGGTMLGTSKTIKNNQTKAFEFLRIEQTESGARYIPYINGKEASHFQLTTATASLAKFENPENDFPQVIEYRLVGNSMEITLSSPAQSFSYTLTKQPAGSE